MSLIISTPSRVVLTCWSMFTGLESSTDIIWMKKLFFSSYSNFFSTFYNEYTKYIAKVKEFYNKHPYTYHIDSIINILLYLFYHRSSHPSIHPSIDLSFLVAFQK